MLTVHGEPLPGPSARAAGASELKQKASDAAHSAAIKASYRAPDEMRSGDAWIPLPLHAPPPCGAVRPTLTGGPAKGQPSPAARAGASPHSCSRR